MSPIMTSTDFRLVVFSDIDGTLIDRKTYSPALSLPALNLCREKNIPIVLVSGKTRCEIEKLRSDLEIDSPFISENGGGLYIPDRFFMHAPEYHKVGTYKCICSKESIQVLQEFLHNIANEHNIVIKSFEQLSVDEVSRLTGLDTESARLAKLREFDEPFIIIDETEEKVKTIRESIEKGGFRYNFGGSLHHIMGNFDKGERVRELMKLFRAANAGVKFAACGDAYNDIAMLKHADYAFWVGAPESAPDKNNFAGELIITSERGPKGFAQAIEQLVEKLDN
jgi:mannosyl-3-phosphoglycerate phosphatase